MVKLSWPFFNGKPAWRAWAVRMSGSWLRGLRVTVEQLTDYKIRRMLTRKQFNLTKSASNSIVKSSSVHGRLGITEKILSGGVTFSRSGLWTAWYFPIRRSFVYFENIKAAQQAYSQWESFVRVHRPIRRLGATGISRPFVLVMASSNL